MAFARSLPQMRRAISRDLARRGMPREKVLACALRVLSCCFLRPGSRQYAKENGSFGVATLRRRHVEVEGTRIRLDFPGKSGKRQMRELADPRVARIVAELLRHPGEVFKYRDEEGRWVDLRRRHLNDYIKEVMGERFSAKDFRTWAGTLLCAGALAQTGVEPDESPTARHRKLVAAIRETARHLGNTPAICRASYVSPSILDRFENGRVIDRRFETLEQLVQPRSSGLHPAEKALLRLLGSNSS